MIGLNITTYHSTSDSANFDIQYIGTTSIILHTLERIVLPTGRFIVTPDPDWKIEIYPRSGLAAKHGITVLNTPGQIDPDFSDEIKVILINLGKDSHTIYPGDRIAQGAFVPVHRPDYCIKGGPRIGGLGSTGN